MRYTLPTRVVRVFLIFMALLLMTVGQSASAAINDGIPCDNPHEATAVDIAAGYPAGQLVCPDDYEATGVTEESGEAKIYLNSLPKLGLSLCAPPNEANITRLNPTFAICAARFFRAYTARYGGVVITSAFRDDTPGSSPLGGPLSANQCAGGARDSNHARGIAIDVTPASGDWESMWNFASNNPQFGVCFPFQDVPFSGYPNGDRPHMVLAGGGGSEAARCAAQGVVSTCEGTVYDPSTFVYTPAQPRPLIEIAETVGEYFYPELTEGEQSSPYPLLSALIDTIFSLPMSQNPSENNDENNPFPFLSGERTSIFSGNNRFPSPRSTSTQDGISIYSGWRSGADGSTTTSPFILIVNRNDSSGIESGTSSPDTIVWQGNEYQLIPIAQETFSYGTPIATFPTGAQRESSGFFQSVATAIRSFFRGILESLTSSGN